MVWAPKRVLPPLLLCLLLGLSPGLSACSTLLGDEPPLPDSTFTRILVDLHLTTARGNRSSDLHPGVRDSLFAYHDVERAEFEATLRYYSRHPNAFESLYDAVIDTLNALQSRSPSRPGSIPKGATEKNRPIP